VTCSFIDQTDRLHHAAFDPIYDTVGVDDLSDIDRDYGCRHPHDARLTINIAIKDGCCIHTYVFVARESHAASTATIAL
jgi:hypothetical protein